MKITDIIIAACAVVALGLSIYTLCRVQLTPFNLEVLSSGRIRISRSNTQFIVFLPLTFVNKGAKEGVIKSVLLTANLNGRELLTREEDFGLEIEVPKLNYGSLRASIIEPFNSFNLKGHEDVYKVIGVPIFNFETLQPGMVNCKLYCLHSRSDSPVLALEFSFELNSNLCNQLRGEADVSIYTEEGKRNIEEILTFHKSSLDQ